MSNQRTSAGTAADSSTQPIVIPSADIEASALLAAVINPSEFCTYPWSSVLLNSESETIALNIMTILKRTGNTFRELSWDEYKKERLNDGRFSEREKIFFEKVIPYCKSVMTARLFCGEWSNCG